MRYERVLLLGGTGFVGGHLAAELVRRGKQVFVPTRNPRGARRLLPLPRLTLLPADVHDDETLQRLVAGSDAVINLVGILHDERETPWGPRFEHAHVRLPARIGTACEQAGVARLLHMSALGVVSGGETSAPSMYLRSKAAGEREVREHGPSCWTIFRPSVIFADDDHLTTLFASLQRIAPVLAMGRAQSRFQPVHVADVAQAYANALDDRRCCGKIYELGGADIVTLRELVQLAGRLTGRPRPVIGLPDWAGRLQASLLEKMPGPPLMSVDNFDSLGVPNVMSGPIAPELGVRPRGLRSWIEMRCRSTA